MNELLVILMIILNLFHNFVKNMKMASVILTKLFVYHLLNNVLMELLEKRLH